MVFPAELCNDVIRHAERIVELKLQPRGVIERGRDVLLQSLQSARCPQLAALFRVGFSKGPLRLPRRYREELGCISQNHRGMFEDKGSDFLQGDFVFDDVGLVQRKDNLLAPGQDPLQELPLALRKRMIGGGGEQHQVTARDELIGQALVIADDRIGARAYPQC